METEDQICRRYEVELGRIAALDHAYYRSLCPTLAERRDYAARQTHLEEVRTRLYLELGILRQSAVIPFHRRCRSVIRRPRSF
jgi:hypothetical protein